MFYSLKLAAPCGLYCGVCSTSLEGVCHGCGCQANDCLAAEKHTVCSIYLCVQERGLQDCSSCEDFPCTKLIQFAFDPVMRTHLPVLYNLARRKKIGIKAWIREQQTYWNENQDKFHEWILFHQECKRKRNEIKTR
jgi:hypothetical protein